MNSQGKWIVGSIVLVAALVGIGIVAMTQGPFSLVQPTSVQAQVPAGTLPPAAAPKPAAAAGANPNASPLAVAAPAAASGGDAVPQDLEKSSCIDLSAFLRMKADDFDKVKTYPWPAAPRGSQTLVGVPVDIRGALMLWGQANADRGMKYPESVTGIGCKQKFETLYILHGAFFEGAKGEPMFDVVLHYEGGEKHADTVLCGDDARDWYVNKPNESLGPAGQRSTLAWVGEGKSGERDQKIRFCMTAIENKHPDRVVGTIDLASSKKKAAGCILAITVGKAGLMKPMPDKPTVSGRETGN